MTTTYACMSAGGIPDGGVARTVEVPGGFHVDLDDQDRVIGVETYGEDTDWVNALAALAMQGRLTVPRRQP